MDSRNEYSKCFERTTDTKTICRKLQNATLNNLCPHYERKKKQKQKHVTTGKTIVKREMEEDNEGRFLTTFCRGMEGCQRTN